MIFEKLINFIDGRNLLNLCKTLRETELSTGSNHENEEDGPKIQSCNISDRLSYTVVSEAVKTDLFVVNGRRLIAKIKVAHLRGIAYREGGYEDLTDPDTIKATENYLLSVGMQMQRAIAETFKDKFLIVAMQDDCSLICEMCLVSYFPLLQTRRFRTNIAEEIVATTYESRSIMSAVFKVIGDNQAIEEEFEE